MGSRAVAADPDPAEPVRPDGVSVLDVGLGVAAATVARPVRFTVRVGRGVGGRATRASGVLVDTLVLRPLRVPPWVRPEDALLGWSRRGHRERLALEARLESLLDALVPRIADEVIRRLDVEELMTRLDVAGVVRDATGAVSSEAVREARLRALAGDDNLARVVDRFLLRDRRRRDPSPDAAEP